VQPKTKAGQALLGILRQQTTNRERLTADGATEIILAIEREAIPSPAAPLAETMTRLADSPRSKWHDEVLPNGAGESWVCVPIADVLDALPTPAATPRAWVKPARWSAPAATPDLWAALDKAGDWIVWMGLPASAETWRPEYEALLAQISVALAASQLAPALDPAIFAEALKRELNRTHKAGEYEELAASILEEYRRLSGVGERPGEGEG
jgi:hypothetical protein